MLFLFDEPTTGAFWMKDTDIPLSIGFIGEDDQLVDLVDMQPCSSDPCRLYTSRDAYVFALEMNQGWFDAHGIETGDRVDVRIATE